MTLEEAIEVVRKSWPISRNMDLREALEVLIPELTESEDEKIRKEIISALKFANDDGVYDKHIAYLEKQKELKTPEEKIKHPLYVEGFEAGKQVGAQYESVFGKQKPVEWSEEDEEEINIISEIIEHCTTIPYSGGTLTLSKEHKKKLQYFIKSLHPQPKQEWSEVELEFRGEKVKVKRPFFRDDKGRGYSTTEQDDDAAWYALRAWCEKKGVSLYDLYPREEWSEDGKKMIDTIVSVLGQYIDYKAISGTSSGYAIPRYNKEIDWLKSLRPSWKPSEEQMEELNKVRTLNPGLDALY